jgi:hypothetical protein
MPHKVICPKCQKEFTIPPEHGDVWRMCPYCSEVNTAALVRTPPALGCLGVLLLLAGVLGGTVGTFLCFIGMQFSGHTQFLTFLWAWCSIAIFATGVRLLRASHKPNVAESPWGAGGAFICLLVLGICGWVFVFATCIQ